MRILRCEDNLRLVVVKFIFDGYEDTIVSKLRKHYLIQNANSENDSVTKQRQRELEIDKT